MIVPKYKYGRYAGLNSKNPMERFLSFCDKHHYAILNTNMAAFTIASIILFAFHNKEHGFEEASFSYDLGVTIFPLMIFISGYDQSKKSNDTNRRILTLIFLTYLAASITVLIVYAYNVFVTEMSGKEAIIFTIPLFILAIIIFGNIAPSIAEKTKNDLELLFKYFGRRK